MANLPRGRSPSHRNIIDNDSIVIKNQTVNQHMGRGPPVTKLKSHDYYECSQLEEIKSKQFKRNNVTVLANFF